MKPFHMPGPFSMQGGPFHQGGGPFSITTPYIPPTGQTNDFWILSPIIDDPEWIYPLSSTNNELNAVFLNILGSQS